MLQERKKHSVTLVKDGKTDFLQDHHDRCRNRGIGVLQWGREIRLNSEYSLGKWEFIAKEQSGAPCMEGY